MHCRKCGLVFCSKCIREQIFDIDGLPMFDANLIKALQQELKQKLRETKICINCEKTFKTQEKNLIKQT